MTRFIPFLLLIAGCQTVTPAVPVAVVPVPVCAPAEEALRTLFHEYREKPIGMGAAADGTVVVILASPSGTWTLIAIRPDGMACLKAEGEAWEAVNLSPKGQGT